MKATEKAYIAGFLDGEGSITMSKGSTSARRIPYLAVQLTQHATRREVLDFCASKFGGEVKVLQPQNHAYIQWHGSKAKKMLLKLLPYLILKKGLAKLAITYEVTRELLHKELLYGKPKDRLPPEYMVKLQDQTYSMIKALNNKVTRTSVTETEREDLISLHKKMRRVFLEERNGKRQSTPQGL